AFLRDVGADCYAIGEPGEGVVADGGARRNAIEVLPILAPRRRRVVYPGSLVPTYTECRRRRRTAAGSPESSTPSPTSSRRSPPRRRSSCGRRCSRSWFRG